MTKEEARSEINVRLERETQYILALAATPGYGHSTQVLARALLDNNETIKLLGKYLETTFKDKWEKFYRKEYWDKR